MTEPGRRDIVEALDELAEFLTLDGDRSVVAPWLLREAAEEIRAARIVSFKGLTEQDIEDRKKWIGGSDARIIMDGKPVEIQELLEVKRGERPNKSLADVLIVQLGIETEDLNRRWFTMKTGRPVTNANERMLDPACHWRAATVDGLTTTWDGQDAVFEAKYTSGRMRMEQLVEKYYPQLQHNMSVLVMHWAVLSVIFGDGTWAMAEVEYNEEYCRQMYERQRVFWDCRMSRDRRPWPEMPAPIRPDIEKVLKLSKPVDMSQHNEWCMLAPEWLRLKDATDQFKTVDGSLKALVNREVRKCYGAGLIATVSKNGAVTVKADPDWQPANDDELTY